MLLGLGKVLKNYKKAGIILSIFTILFFSYGHFFSVMTDLRIVLADGAIGPNKILFPLWLVFFALLIRFAFMKSRSHYTALTKILNVAAIVLVIFPFINIVSQISKTPHSISSKINARSSAIQFVNSSRIEEYRDIYYLIFDRYANSHSLKEFYDFDNSEFLNNLTDLGFYVAQDSTANYLKTAHSLSSSLNMEYINWLGDVMGKDSEDWSPLYNELLQNYKLLIYLKSKGYKIMHFGSWWQPTAKNEFADYNFIFGWSSRFHQLLFESTVISPIMRLLSLMHIIDHPDFYLAQWQRVRKKFNELEEIPKIGDLTFAFVHMNIPHNPHVFDENGNFTNIKEWDFSREGYLGQVIYVNKRIEELVRKLIKDSNPSPIIIIQSDEGPFPLEYVKNEEFFDWTKANKAQLRKKMGILNAYYFPDIDEEDILYQSITPVNTFRVMLNSYFKEKIDLLPDRNYIFKDHQHLYEFYDVTDKIKYD